MLTHFGTGKFSFHANPSCPITGDEFVKLHVHTIGGSKGAPGMRAALGVQILSISCSFGGKIGQIIAFYIHIWSWCPHLGKTLDLPVHMVHTE